MGIDDGIKPSSSCKKLNLQCLMLARWVMFIVIVAVASGSMRASNSAASLSLSALYPGTIVIGGAIYAKTMLRIYLHECTISQRMIETRVSSGISLSITDPMSQVRKQGIKL